MVEPCPEVAHSQLGDFGGMSMLPKEVNEMAKEIIVPGDRFGAQTFAGVVEFETFNQCLDFHEQASSRFKRRLWPALNDS